MTIDDDRRDERHWMQVIVLARAGDWTDLARNPWGAIP